jgi:hypothetical protein
MAGKAIVIAGKQQGLGGIAIEMDGSYPLIPSPSSDEAIHI